MHLTGTHIAYYHVCHRKLWLFANGINMEQTSDIVSEGRLIGETAYADRSQKFTEIELDGIKIDFYDPKRQVVHEVKKSSAVEQAHIAQVQYYLYKLKQRGVKDPTGIIEYPKLRQREHVPPLTDVDVETITNWEKAIATIVAAPTCPDLIHARICKKCSYFDFCYSTEQDPTAESKGQRRIR
jgi:CRISPR-associated exonuclease Cas4